MPNPGRTSILARGMSTFGHTTDEGAGRDQAVIANEPAEARRTGRERHRSAPGGGPNNDQLSRHCSTFEGSILVCLLWGLRGR
jgi:hypothetical protein